MRYDIGEYGLTREKDVCWASPNKPIHYLWYVEGSVEGEFGSYEEAVERIKEKMRSDKETGRQDEKLKQGDLIIYFTGGWADQSCTLKMHIAGTYDKETLDIVHEYDDRIIVEEL
jgi:hypothetical protein